jgi:hypothetical protein
LIKPPGQIGRASGSPVRQLEMKGAASFELARGHRLIRTEQAERRTFERNIRAGRRTG